MALETPELHMEPLHLNLAMEYLMARVGHKRNQSDTTSIQKHRTTSTIASLPFFLF
jgi:hypothetical protein